MMIYDDDITAFFEELSLLLASNITMQEALATVQRGQEKKSIRALIELYHGI